MNGVALGDKTRSRLEAVFPIDLRREAAALLVHLCGADLPDFEKATPKELERIRFAALKVSEGTIDGLCEAIELAEEDWRDLLVNAGFAEDPRAHKRWMP